MFSKFFDFIRYNRKNVLLVIWIEVIGTCVGLTLLSLILWIFHLVRTPVEAPVIIWVLSAVLGAIGIFCSFLLADD